MTVEEILQRKRELEEELEQLRKDYVRETSPCGNKKCAFYRENYKNHCSWTWWHTECPDYIEEE